MKIKYVTLFNDTSNELHHGRRESIKNLYSLLHLHGFHILKSCSISKDWRKDATILKAIDYSDLVIVNGEGILNHSQPKALLLASLAPYVADKGKPIALINATYEKNCQQMADMLSRFDRIFVRETHSQQELAAYHIAATVVPDLTFYSANKSLSKPTLQASKIGYTDTITDTASSALYNVMHKIPNSHYLPIIAKPGLDWRRPLKSTSQKILFNTTHTYNAFKLKLSQKAPTWIDTRRLHTLDNTEAYKTKLNECQFIITARFHTLCFSLQQAIPFLAIPCRSHKVKGLLHDIGIGTNRILTDTAALATLQFTDYALYTSEELGKINHYIKHARYQIQDMFKQLRSLAT